MCSFTAEVDGRTIQGVVKETEEAKTDYKEAIRSGHTAFLVEEKLPDVFKVGEMNVFHLKNNIKFCRPKWEILRQDRELKFV